MHSIWLNSCLQCRKHYLVILTGEWTPGYLSSVSSYAICLMGNRREITLLSCASTCSARNIGLTFVMAQQTFISQLHLLNTCRKQVLDFAQIWADLTESCRPSAEPLPASNSPSANRLQGLIFCPSAVLCYERTYTYVSLWVPTCGSAN